MNEHAISVKRNNNNNKIHLGTAEIPLKPQEGQSRVQIQRDIIDMPEDVLLFLLKQLCSMSDQKMALF